MMSHLLKAMGFWIWGLIVIGLSVTLVSVNSRVLSLFRAHDRTVTSSEMLVPESASSRGPKVSRIIEKDPTGAASPEDKNSTTQTLFTIAATTGQYQKTIDYGEQLVDSGSAIPKDVAIVAQAFYQLKDCKNSVVWADKAVAVARKAGEAPRENLYLFKLQCASDAGDNAAMIPILIDLIRLNDKSTYWNTLLRIERQDERDDRGTLMLYRIMYDRGAMTVGSDYIEMAQLH